MYRNTTLFITLYRNTLFGGNTHPYIVHIQTQEITARIAAVETSHIVHLQTQEITARIAAVRDLTYSTPTDPGNHS